MGGRWEIVEVEAEPEAKLSEERKRGEEEA
jgi:hypothetical protein